MRNYYSTMDGSSFCRNHLNPQSDDYILLTQYYLKKRKEKKGHSRKYTFGHITQYSLHWISMKRGWIFPLFVTF